jgi:uncharacterized protein YkwD
MTWFTASEHPAIDEVVPYELAIHEETNRVRRQKGVKEVEYNAHISYISRIYCQNMAKMNKFGHGVGGETLTERLQQYSLSCVDAAENLAKRVFNKGYISRLSEQELADTAVTGWLDSDEGHRENLLNPEWNYEGVGVYVTAENEVYVTQTFTARDCEGPGDPPRYGEGDDG